MLMNLSGQAQSSYPSKVIIGSDTVIQLKVEQFRMYVNWRNDLDECSDIDSEKNSKILLLDSIIKAQNKLILSKDIQSIQYSKLVAKMNDISDLQTDKYNALDKAFKQQAIKSKFRTLVTGLTTGSVVFAVAGLLIYQVVK